jgi:RuvB-like protein 2
VTLTAEALNVLTSMAVQTTLRYALNLISCAQVLARKRKAEKVDVDDLRRAYTYFMDEKRSVQWVKDQQGFLMFEVVRDEKDVMDVSS